MNLQVWLGDSGTEKVNWHPEKERSPHTVLIGGSGSGKTEALKVICFDLKKKKVPSIIIDFHNDFKSFADNLITLENASLHPFEIQEEEKPIDVIYRVAKSFAKLFKFGEVQEATLRKAIKIFFQRSGIKDFQSKKYYSHKLLPFSNFEDILSDEFDKKETASLRAKIGILFDLPLFMNAEETSLPFESMSKDVSVIELKEYPTDEVKALIAEIIMHKLINQAYLKGQKPLDQFLIIDEAHRVTYDGSPIDLLLRESRKYGIGVILASQRPQDFSENILANIGTLISFQCNLAKDSKYVASMMDISPDQVKALNKPGKCIVKYSSGIINKTRIIRANDRTGFQELEESFDEEISKKAVKREQEKIQKEKKEKEEYVVLKTQVPELKKTIKELESENQKINKSYSDAKLELNSLNKENKELESTNTRLENKLQKYEENNKLLTEQLNNLTAENKSLNKEIKTIKEEKNKLSKQIESNNNIKEHLEAENKNILWQINKSFQTRFVLNKIDQTLSKAENYCNVCGFGMKKNDKFCERCGGEA